MNGEAPGRSKVSVVVVSYNSASCIGRCLRSVLETQTAVPPELVVVDNHSADHTVAEAVRTAPQARIVRNETNRGFAAACNQGITAAKGDYILLLNPDAALYPDTMNGLADYLRAHPAVGIVGPCLVDEDGAPHRDVSATGAFPGLRQALAEYTLLGRTRIGRSINRSYFLLDRDRFQIMKAAMVQGACFMFRRSLWEQVGGFDEGFFLYFEETDFCKRCSEAGMEIYYVGRVKCLHLGGQSMPGGRQSSFHFFRSFYRYHRKHSGGAVSCLLRLCISLSLLLEYSAHVCVRSLRKRGDPAFDNYVQVLRTRLVVNLSFLSCG